ncbi:PDR/VanB family oxidoreductase [Streptomyces sp. NBC_00063]|uniref:PDR/VanB family oxidoreductase n=1 Tax=Streptomyces sp. NBC_00063 TaxID=2975638 RepID=UPI003D724D8D
MSEAASGASAFTATVEERHEATADIALLTLRPPFPVQAPPPGSHLDVAVRLPTGPETRSYSLVDLGHDDGLLRIAVRKEPDGRGGSAWMHRLRPGDEVEVTGPLDEFPLTPGPAPSLLLAAGVGITPVLGLARALKARGGDYRVLYTGRARPDMAFTDALEAAHGARATVVESTQRGRVRAHDVISTLSPDGVLYVCGPMALLKDVRRVWEQDGRAPANLRFETFATSGALPARHFRVDVPSRGVSVDVPVGTSMLDALQEAGVELMYDCRRGECGLCRVRVLAAEGTVDHRDVFLSARQKNAGRHMCACVSRVAGTRVTIDC